MKLIISYFKRFQKHRLSIYNPTKPWYNENCEKIIRRQFMNKSILTTLLFAVLYFLCMGIGVLLGNLFDQTGNMFYAPAFTALVGGSVYMILVAKVPRFGAITTIGLVIALFFLGEQTRCRCLPSWNYLCPPSRWSSSFRKIQGPNKKFAFFHYFRL